MKKSNIEYCYHKIYYLCNEYKIDLNGNDLDLLMQKLMKKDLIDDLYSSLDNIFFLFKLLCDSRISSSITDFIRLLYLPIEYHDQDIISFYYTAYYQINNFLECYYSKVENKVPPGAKEFINTINFIRNYEKNIKLCYRARYGLATKHDFHIIIIYYMYFYHNDYINLDELLNNILANDSNYYERKHLNGIYNYYNCMGNNEALKNYYMYLESCFNNFFSNKIKIK